MNRYQSAADWESDAEQSPLRFAFKVIFAGSLVVAALIAGCTALSLFSSVASVATTTVQVAGEQFGPRALLTKYEWFKDASAALDKKVADVSVYQVRLSSLESAYTGQRRSEWPRDDREQYAIWSSEVAGVKASYNTLASEYNAEMAKFNWRFANRGMLPEGASAPLPREYKPYLEQ